MYVYKDILQIRLYSEVGILIDFSLFAACISHSDTMGTSPQEEDF